MGMIVWNNPGPLIRTAKITYRTCYALHPLAEKVLQLKYDLLSAEKSYDPAKFL
jgi:hypothetical protein